MATHYRKLEMKQRRSYKLYRRLRRVVNSEVLARDVIKFIGSVPTVGLTRCNRHGDSPLHSAVNLLDARCSQEAEIVRLLATRVPETISKQNKKLQTPIHLMVIKGFDKSTIMYVARLNPQALTMKDINGDTPLHCACYKKNPDIQIAIDLALQDPDQLACQNNAYYTPAHLLCSERPRDLATFHEPFACFNAPFVRGNLIHDLWLTAFSHPNRDGEYPLHTFLRRGGHGTDLLAFQIATWYPEAVCQKSTIDGAYPLHLAARFHSSSNILLHELTELFPQALRIPDNKGRLPIHHLFQFGPMGLVSFQSYHHGSVHQVRHDEIVSGHTLGIFITRFPESLRIHDADGQIPHSYATSMAESLGYTEPMMRILKDLLRGST